MVVDLFPSDPLLVSEDYSDLGEDDEVTNNLEGTDYLFPVNQDRAELGLELLRSDLGCSSENGVEDAHAWKDHPFPNDGSIVFQHAPRLLGLESATGEPHGKTDETMAFPQRNATARERRDTGQRSRRNEFRSRRS